MLRFGPPSLVIPTDFASHRRYAPRNATLLMHMWPRYIDFLYPLSVVVQLQQLYKEILGRLIPNRAFVYGGLSTHTESSSFQCPPSIALLFCPGRRSELTQAKSGKLCPTSSKTSPCCRKCTDAELCDVERWDIGKKAERLTAEENVSIPELVAGCRIFRVCPSGETIKPQMSGGFGDQ